MHKNELNICLKDAFKQRNELDNCLNKFKENVLGEFSNE